MMDEFDNKRGMIKLLLEMLKGSASKEVSDGMHMPEDGKGLAVEKVSVIPHEDDEDMPEKMADGGMPAESDEPGHMYKAPEQMADGSADEEAVSNLPGEIEDREGLMDHRQDFHNKSNVEDDQENNESAFQAFLPRKKKK